MLWDVQITQQKKKKKYLYSIYIGLLKEILKSVLAPSWSLVCLGEKKKCQISLKSQFHQVLQISEPNAALSNVGGCRGGSWDSLPSFHAGVFPADPPQKKREG